MNSSPTPRRMGCGRGAVPSRARVRKGIAGSADPLRPLPAELEVGRHSWQSPRRRRALPSFLLNRRSLAESPDLLKALPEPLVQLRYQPLQALDLLLLRLQRFPGAG